MKAEPAPLYACPRCRKVGFTRRGLALHYCRGVRGEALPTAWKPNGDRSRLTPDELKASLAAPVPTQRELL